MDKKQIQAEMEKLGFTFDSETGYPVEENIERFVALQKLMREWFRYEVSRLLREEGMNQEALEKIMNWSNDSLDEMTEEWLVG